MSKLRIYLDTCCYNRPYDAKTQDRIMQECFAKMNIQYDISVGKYNLVTSMALDYEISRKKDEGSRSQIQKYLTEHSFYYVGAKDYAEVYAISKGIMDHGLKLLDATHLACAIVSKCDYFITVDDEVTNYCDPRIMIINPVDFVRLGE